MVFWRPRTRGRFFVRVIRGRFLSYIYCAFDDIHILEDLEPQVIVECWIVCEEFINDRKCAFVALTADKCTEPAVDEEDLARSFVIGQLF